MADYRRIQFQKKFLKTLAEGINSNLSPDDETMRVYNECLLNDDLKKWWRYLKKIDDRKKEEREELMRSLITN